MSISRFGIYEEAIKNEVEKASALLEDAVKVLETCDFNGYENDINALHRADLDEIAMEYLKANGDFSDITNSIITAYHNAVMETVNNLDAFQEMGVEVTNYVNCDDSHLYVEVNGATSEVYEEGDFKKAVLDGLYERNIDTLEIMVEDLLQDTGKQYPREWIEEDFHTEGGDINLNAEFLASVQAGELTTPLVEHIEKYAQPIEKSQGKDTIERD